MLLGGIPVDTFLTSRVLQLSPMRNGCIYQWFPECTVYIIYAASHPNFFFLKQTWLLLFRRVHVECFLDQFFLSELLNVLSYDFIWSGIESWKLLMYLHFSPGSGARGILPPVYVCSTEFVAVLVFVGLVCFSSPCCVSCTLFQKVT